MGSKSRRKGADGERAVVAISCALGLRAVRTWHTAQSQDETERACDVQIEGVPCQVKVKAGGFAGLYALLNGVKFAMVRKSGGKWVMVVDGVAGLEMFRLAKKLGFQFPNSQGTD